MSTNKNARQDALGFAALGYAVLPLHGATERGGKRVCTCGDADCESPAKHPHPRLAPHGLKDATDDVVKIKAWPHAWLNFGVVTDPFLIVDVDARNGGLENWKKLYRRTTRYLPHTWQVNTGGGGLHIFFANTIGAKCGKLAKGVDIKAIGGYVVGVGSTHISGKQYYWAPGCAPNEAPLAEPPQWLLDELEAQHPPGERVPAEHWKDLCGNPIVDGSRNQSFLQLAGHLLGCGVNPEIAWSAIRCMNLVLSVPPEDEEKLGAMFNRVMGLEIKKRGL